MSLYTTVYGIVLRFSVSVRQFIHGFIICLLHGDVPHHLVLANRLVGVGESKKDDQSK